MHIQGEGTKYRGLIARKFALESTHYDQEAEGRNVWLIKPNDFNRGRGVRLFNRLD